MAKAITSKLCVQDQLIVLGVDLSYKVLGMLDCNPELEKDAHFVRAYECAKQWNKVFIEEFISPTEGVK